MKFFFLSLLLIGSVAFAGNPSPKAEKASPTPAVGTKYGEMKAGEKVVSLENILENYTDFKGKMVSFEAVPKKVCEKKGCWMVLEEGTLQVRTLFKDYGFFVPKEILGKKVRVQGMMEQKKISAATLRHFMKDEGKKMEEIKKVKTGEVRFQFVASGVEVVKS